MQLPSELLETLVGLAPGGPRRGVVREHLDGARTDQPGPLGSVPQSGSDGYVGAHPTTTEAVPGVVGVTLDDGCDRRCLHRSMVVRTVA